MDTVLAEIMEAPSVVRETLREGQRRIPSVLRGADIGASPLYGFGAGTSYFVAVSGRYTLDEYTRFRMLCYPSSDFALYGLRGAKRDDVALAISQSGHSGETIAAAAAAKDRGMRVLALTNQEDSPLARLGDGLLLLRAGPEEGPGTKTVLGQCVLMYQFALHLAIKAGGDRADEARMALDECDEAPGLVESMLGGPTAERIHQLAGALSGFEHAYVIGAGPLGVLGLHAANLLGELARIHCYAFDAAEFRHGPLEAVDSSSLVIALGTEDCRGREHVIRACQLVSRIGATLVYVGDEGGAEGIEADFSLCLPRARELLAAQLYLAPLQYLAYWVAKKRQVDPNRFSNIVKTWTD